MIKENYMENSNNSKEGLSRRKFLGNTAAIAAFSVIPAGSFGKSFINDMAEKGAAPDSKFGGVQIEFLCGLTIGTSGVQIC